MIIGLSQWIILAGILALAGCRTTTNETGAATSGTMKLRGVYTTLAGSGPDLDMQGPDYLTRRTFSPGQAAEAVVIGYGDDAVSADYADSFEVRLVESATGTLVQTFKSQQYGGKANIFPLPIRKGGKYRLELFVRGTLADTWDFTVNRDTSADIGAAADQPRPYATGNFSVSFAGLQTLDAFAQYDQRLLWALNNAVEKELNHANQDAFAQMPAGHVTIQFDLGANGEVTTPQIIDNTLSGDIGQFFLRALQNGAPYQAWPASVRTANGSTTRTLSVTFYYD